MKRIKNKLKELAKSIVIGANNKLNLNLVIYEDEEDDYIYEGKHINFEEAIKNIGTDEWKRRVKEAGIDKLAGAIDDIKDMPDETLDESIARMTRFIETVSFKHNRKE